MPREVQRRALREALALTADLGWIDRQGVSKNVYNRVQACEYLQRRIARTLLEKLGTLDLAGFEGRRSLYGRPHGEGPRGVVRGAAPFARTADGTMVRNLQQSLLKSTVAAANVKDKPSSGFGKRLRAV